VIYGAVLIAFMFVERNGIVGLGRRIWRLGQRRRGTHKQEDPASAAAEPAGGVRTAGS
jgi:hypothetical protein